MNILTKRAFKWSAHILVAILIYRWSKTELAQTVFEFFTQVKISNLISLALLSLFLMLISALRWARLIVAFGNEAPSLLTLLRLSLIGHFYNTFVPGAVGGDVVRASLTRDFYRKKQTSYLVVIGERFLGVVGLGVVFMVGLWGWTEARHSHAEVLLPILVGLAVLILSLLVFRRQVMERFGKYFDELRQPLALTQALGLSIFGQVCTVTLFWLIATSFSIEISMMSLLFICPLGLLASVIPITVLGAGARELALISLFTAVGGIEEASAVSISTTYLGCLWFLAVLGGVWQLLAPKSAEA